MIMAIFGVFYLCVSQAGAVITAEQCAQAALPEVTFSVMTKAAQDRLEQLGEIDKADDGRINFASADYMAQLADLPSIEPGKLDPMTFVVDRWFPLEYIEGEAVPAIRIFLRQEALKNPEGVVTNNSKNGAIIYLPKQGQAVPAMEAASVFVSHVCVTRAKMYGAAST